MLKLSRFKAAAAVQVSPVYLNASATAEKAASLVREAAAICAMRQMLLRLELKPHVPSAGALLTPQVDRACA